MANVVIISEHRIKMFDTLDQGSFRKDLVTYLNTLSVDAPMQLVVREEIAPIMDSLLFEKGPSAEGSKGPFRGITVVKI